MDTIDSPQPGHSTSKVEYSKKTQNAWAFYDWANSVYPLVITTAIFPIFYETHTTTFNGDVPVSDKVEFFGTQVTNTSLITYVGAAYFLLICVMVPFLSGIADYSGRKKTFLRFFCYMGSIACIGLFFFDKAYLEWSMVIYAFAGIGFWSSLVFYNAYLPEIAPIEQHDRLSAKGFSMGYIGSVVLLVLCLVLIQVMGVDARYSFVLTGFWWIGFSHITYARLPASRVNRAKEQGLIWKGFRELKLVFKQVRKTKRLKRYLAGFFVYSMAVQTIMIMAVYFGQKELRIPQTGLIISVLLIQLIAVPGAYGLSRVSNKIGNIKALGVILVMWILLCISALFIHTETQFYVIAGFVGLVMGGIQSLSRSTYSKFLPKGTVDTSSFFSFYDVSEKLGIVIGMLSYGLIEELTGSMRNSIVALMIFFVIGLIILFTVPKEEVELDPIH